MANRDQDDGWRSDRPEASGGRGPGAGANAEHGYGQGGYTASGQMADGGSDLPARGFGGANAGGFGQQTQNSQWGQGGMGPMTQGANYSQGGGQFGSAGSDFGASAERGHPQPNRGPAPPHQDPGRSGPAFGSGPQGASGQAPYGSAGQAGYGQDARTAGPFGQSYAPPPHHDDHEPHYRHWRDSQLAAHDRDYARWRDEQTRKYDEDYGAWRNERHSTFSREFEGWRAGRGGQASGSAPLSSDERPSGERREAATASTVNPSERSVYGAGGTTGPTAADAGKPAAYPAPAALGPDDRGAVDANLAHGANPALAAIADGTSGSHRSLPEADDRRGDVKANDRTA